MSILELIDINHDDSFEIPAIIYVDFDGNIGKLSRIEFDRLTREISGRFPADVPVIEIDDVVVDSGQTISVQVPGPLIIFGDCHQYTPVFMVAALRSRMPFYYVDDLGKISETILSKSTAMITPENRLNELTRRIKRPFHRENIIEGEEFILLTFEQTKLNVSKNFSNICYMINTSGTFATKTIMVPNDSIVSNIQDFSKNFRFEQKNDRILICSPFTFDPAICDLFLGLSLRIEVILISNSLRNIPEKFSKIIKKFQITFMTITPSLWRRISLKLLQHQKLSLKQVNFGGEKSPTLKELKSFRKMFRISNLYGLTEMSVWASIFNLDNDDDTIVDHLPIYGRPVADTKLYLNDDDDEIIIESDIRKCLIFDGQRWMFLSKIHTGDIGYRQGKNIYYLERKDRTMIKLNGVKCFPGIIESLILDRFAAPNNLVQDCLAVPGRWRDLDLIDLIVVIVDKHQRQIIRKQIIGLLAEKWPTVAFRIHLVDSDDQVSITNNGKLDRNILLRYIQSSDHVPGNISRNQNEIEDELKEIIQNVLPHGTTLDDDDRRLTDYGLESMLALQITIEIENRFGVVQDIFETLMTKSFADLIQKISNTEPVMVKKAKIEPIVEQKEKESGICKPESFRLTHQWSCFMEQCVDASPLIVSVANKTILIAASHAGLIRAFDLIEKLFPVSLWQQRIAARIEATPVASSDSKMILITDLSGFIRTFDTVTGCSLWQYRTDDQIKASPCIVRKSFSNPLILCGSYDHHVYCWMEPTGMFQWKIDPDNSAFAATLVPWFDDQQWFIIGGTLKGTLICLNPDGPSIHWKRSLSTKPIFSTAELCSEMKLAIIGLTDCRIIAITITDGSIVWQINTNGPVFGTPKTITILDGQILVIFGTHGTEHGIVCARLYDIGKPPIWSFPTESDVYASPSIHRNGFILVMETNGRLHVFEPETGRRPTLIISGDHQTCWGKVFTKLVPHGHHLYFGSRDSNIHRLCLEPIW